MMADANLFSHSGRATRNGGDHRGRHAQGSGGSNGIDLEAEASFARGAAGGRGAACDGVRTLVSQADRQPLMDSFEAGKDYLHLTNP